MAVLLLEAAQPLMSLSRPCMTSNTASILSSLRLIEPCEYAIGLFCRYSSMVNLSRRIRRGSPHHSSGGNTPP